MHTLHTKDYLNNSVHTDLCTYPHSHAKNMNESKINTWHTSFGRHLTGGTFPVVKGYFGLDRQWQQTIEIDEPIDEKPFCKFYQLSIANEW